MARYEEMEIPFGWFYICETDELNPGEVKEIRRFGEDLMLWRDESGEYHLQETFCPHLGANIGADGKVVGNSIECPFHDWQFNGDGNVELIPYAKEINKKACLKTYPLKKMYAWYMGWFHPEGEAPSYDLPSVPEAEDADYIGPLYDIHDIRTHIQEMVENVVDGAHFVTIHNHDGPAKYTRMEFDGERIMMDSQQLFPGSKGSVEGELNVRTYGLGFSTVTFKTLTDAVMVVSTVPVEKDRTLHINHVYYKNADRDPHIDRVGIALNAEMNRQIKDDQPIWEKKRYVASPKLCSGDGPIHQYRKWANQFYVK